MAHTRASLFAAQTPFAARFVNFCQSTRIPEIDCFSNQFSFSAPQTRLFANASIITPPAPHVQMARGIERERTEGGRVMAHTHASLFAASAKKSHFAGGSNLNSRLPQAADRHPESPGQPDVDRDKGATRTFGLGAATCTATKNSCRHSFSLPINTGDARPLAK